MRSRIWVSSGYRNIRNKKYPFNSMWSLSLQTQRPLVLEEREIQALAGFGAVSVGRFSLTLFGLSSYLTGDAEDESGADMS